MKRSFLVLLILAIACLEPISAQQINVEKLKGLKIRNIGPAGMSGRVTCIDVDLSDPDIIYAGAASGGVWKSESGGIDWEPIFDDQPLQSIGAITINQNNPSEIWVGTGEGNPRNSHNSGAGIYKSIDGGKNWMFMGLENTKTIHRIIVHRDNPNVVFVAAMGSIWGPNQERGVYRTADGGKNWEQILYLNDTTGCADLVVDPTNPNKIIAAMWHYQRKPWTFNSGGAGSGLYVTHDGGESWKRRTEKDGLPKGDLGRIGLAIAPSKPNIIYALVEAKENALYKSTDGGFNWKMINKKGDIGNRPFYYSDIFVDPSNENRVYSLFSLVNRSEDGGKNFETILPYYGVHPDHHAWWIHPEDPSYMINGNDGGLNITRDGGKTWRFIENLPLAQFYHINYDMEVPYRVGGGMQDNGSWVGPSQAWESGGIRNSAWREIYFGDGFDVVFHPEDPRYVYAMSQQGNVGKVDMHTGESKFIKPTHPDTIGLRFNWNAPIAQDPFEPCGIYFGSQFVHKSTDCGNSWEIISPDLTTNDTTKQKQHISGGLTIDATGAENYTTVVAIAPSLVDEAVIWAGTDDGNVQLTRNGGQSWTNLAKKLVGQGMAEGSWITQIEVSGKNAGEAFIVANDYRRNNWEPMVFHTKDYGQSFKRIVDETQASGHALSIVQDPEVEEFLWLGTDNGLYFTIDGGANWNKWTNGYPSVTTMDLKIHPREQDLIVGTFGRAAWILDDIRPIREIAATRGEVLTKAFRLFEAPDAYMAEYKSYQGVRFAADAMFSGDNRFGGAMMTAWLNPDSIKVDKRGKEVTVQIYDMDDEMIRKYKTRLDTGMNRTYWNMRMDGVHYPSRRKVEEKDDLPSGEAVLPGTYKVVVSFNDHKDSTMVTVKEDPRKKIPMSERKAKLEAAKEMESYASMAFEAFEQLKEAKSSIKLSTSMLVNIQDSTKKVIMKEAKAMNKKIADLEELFMTPSGLKGIQRSSDNLSGYFGNARRYIGTLDGAPNQAAERMMERAKAEVEKVLAEVDQFFTDDFRAYQEIVEKSVESVFKPYEPVKMED